jgi:hypothetical protein
VYVAEEAAGELCRGVEEPLLFDDLDCAVEPEAAPSCATGLPATVVLSVEV